MIRKKFRIINESKYLIYLTLTERIFFFFVFILIARNYPLEIYGEMITAFSAAGILIILFDLGLPILLQRETAAKKENASGYLSSVLLINMLLFPLFILFMILICSLFLYDIPIALVILISLAVYFFSVSNILNKSLSGLGDFKSQFVSLLISRIISIAVFLSAVFYFNTGLNILMAIIFCGALIQTSYLLKSISKNKLTINFNISSRPSAGSLIRFSIPLGLAVIFNFLYDKIDILLISKLTDFDQTAYYNAAYGIMKASTISFSFLFASGLTRISILSRNRKAVKLFFSKYSFIILIICIPITLILYFTADFIIKIFYTEKFEDSANVLKILSFALTGLALNNLTGIILNGLGFFRKNMNVTLLGLIINVILNIILIPQYGIAAAAAVTLITEYFVFLGDIFYINKYFKNQI